MYTQAGLDWIDETTMIDVLLRHYPELEPALRGVENAFQPWRRVRPMRGGAGHGDPIVERASERIQTLVG